MSTKLSYVQNLISGSTISCVRFCVDFLQKSFYNLKHLMFGYKKMSLRFNHHVKPELSNQPIPSISHKRLLFSLSPLTVTFLQFPPSQCKLLSFSLPFSFPSARLVYIISNHFWLFYNHLNPNFFLLTRKNLQTLCFSLLRRTWQEPKPLQNSLMKKLFKWNVLNHHH